MASTTARRRRRAHEEEEHENEERWLVSYADMVTLLMCLFMVLFSISSVNTSKFESLQRALQDAFSGKILPGGKAVVQSGSSERHEQSAPEPPLPALTPVEAASEVRPPRSEQERAMAAAREEEELQRLKRRIDALARRMGLTRTVQSDVRRRGLVIRLLTDKVFFDSGQATLKPSAERILRGLTAILAAERRHPIVVEGYTDSQPVRGGAHPTNWELSGARASSVVRRLLRGGVATHRLSLSGFAHQHPIDTNATAEGRARNRRVEVVLTRLYGSGGRP